MTRRASLPSRALLAAAVATSGYVHAALYIGHGYRHIHGVGPAFLLQASGGFAVAALLLVTRSPVIRLGALGVAIGALSGFLASRTFGIFGFTERGFAPAPWALLSVIAEVIAVLVVIVPAWRRRSTSSSSLSFGH
jgi:hypothetical protein